MLKFIKHNMDTITGIGLFPVISFVIFFIFFILAFVWVTRMSKQSIAELESLPLDAANDEDFFHS